MKEFHEWYDQVQEPWRMLLALAIVLPFIALTSVSCPIFAFLGWAGLIAILLSRMWYKYHRAKP